MLSYTRNTFRLQNYNKIINCANDLDKKNKFVHIFISFGQISCQLQDTATGISEWIPTLNLFREGACRKLLVIIVPLAKKYNKNTHLCVCPAKRERTFERSLKGSRSKVLQKLHIRKFLGVFL